MITAKVPVFVVRYMHRGTDGNAHAAARRSNSRLPRHAPHATITKKHTIGRLDPHGPMDKH